MPVPKGMKPSMFYALENKRKHMSGDENDSYLKPGQKDTDDMKAHAKKKAIHKKMGKK